MTHHESKLRAALAVAALMLALFQCWYVYLPDTESVQFHHCRLNEHLDCYKSLSLNGAEMTPFGIPAFPALAGIYCWMAILLGFSFTASEPRRTAWCAWAAILAFPATGLSVYVLLDDIFVSKVTSLSTILILGIGLASCVIGIVRGIPANYLGRGATGAIGFGALAATVGFLVFAAGTTRLDARDLEIERAGKPAQLRWSRFAHDLPRVGAAHLGPETAPRELLLVIDPSDDISRELMKAAAKLAPKMDGLTAIYFYAPTDPRLLEAYADGRLIEFLETPTQFPQRSADGPDLPMGFKRQRDALKKLGVDRYPTALWRGGKQSGAVDLRRIISSLAPSAVRRTARGDRRGLRRAGSYRCSRALRRRVHT